VPDDEAVALEIVLLCYLSSPVPRFLGLVWWLLVIFIAVTRKHSIMPPVYTTDWQNAAQVKTSYFQTHQTGVEARIVG
jgi:hypothetical protein